jgi:anti-sigma regulatory factor (Ser/Thr protein kinase)
VCERTPAAAINLPNNDRAPAVARRFLREQLCETHQAKVADEAELLVSELISNCVRHAAPPVVLRVRCEGDWGLQVEVRDGRTDTPVVRESGDGDESGRGMALVDLLSSAWGVAPHGDGKTTWFRLTQDAAATGSGGPDLAELTAAFDEG